MQFERLRVSGFKSFVDATELLIEPGLTGIVGPNGCGKSNLVEAIRWVMGEFSPRRVRAGEMDDVIFGGTSERPMRNLAEVSLQLDNADRRAPAPFNANDTLEVTRRIERGSGSHYRINGHEVRARDVQLLFADASSGAHSTALVSQGEVGAIIDARPLDRRAILEEAAAITGLHSRRHEAELRLRAADTNLGRLDDVMGTLESQLHGLKRQARQATRYRNLSGHIRRAEAVLLYFAWSEAMAEGAAAAAALAQAQECVAELTRDAAGCAAVVAEAASIVDGLRRAEVEAAAALHRLAVARDRIEADEARVAEDRRELAGVSEQIVRDFAREEELAADADAALARLHGEDTELSVRDDHDDARRTSEERAETAANALAERERELDAQTAAAAGEEARRDSLAREAAELARTQERLRARTAELVEERGRLAAKAQASPGEPTAPQAAEAASAAGARLIEAEAARDRAEAVATEAGESYQTIAAEAARLDAEEQALARLAAGAGGERWPPIIDSVTVAKGIEAALDAALGDDLAAATEAEAPAHWRALAAKDEPRPLPEGATPLSEVVSAPPALGRRLSQIGLVDGDEGARLQERLAQGQRLVSREGALWRWDGYSVESGAPTAAQVRARQCRRLREVRAQRTELMPRLEEARASRDDALARSRAATERAGAARRTAREADAHATQLREADAEATRATLTRASRLAAINDTVRHLEAETAAATTRLDEALGAHEALPAPEVARQRLADLRPDVAAQRLVLAAAERERDSLEEQAAAAAARRSAIVDERQTWQARAQAAKRQLTQLEARRTTTAARRAALDRKPDEIAERRRALLDELSTADTARNRAADSLASAEAELAGGERAARAAEKVLAEAREERVRAEAAATRADERREEAATRIGERLDCAPEDAAAEAGLDANAPVPDVGAVEVRLQRLRRERDTMGPVNLRAEAEAADIDDKLKALRDEHADLEAAIARLRHGIGLLNREGRERLIEAFGRVDGHFRDLFVRLFGGGRAHLALTESGDPLEAGLEVMASPPGKRLQAMSLLSGGEQTLTAVALLFAVFLTNPGPVCILDEVDAALDDANVERLLDLVTDIARQSETRFVLISHNPITMARMNRLYGVTMSERGVSQIVSVDLSRAEALRAAE